MSYKKINLSLVGAAVAASFMISNVAMADNVGQVNVTANADYVVNIQDHSQDFAVNQENYHSAEIPASAEYSIWSNSPETLTVNVSSLNASDTSDTAYLLHTAPGATVDVHEQIPYKILYQACASGTAIEIGGNASFPLNYENANKSICDTQPGSIRVVRLPITDAQGNHVLPAAGSYGSTVTMTVQEPAGGGLLSIS